MWSIKNLCIALALIFTSCSGSKYLRSKVKAKEITELEVFRPLSFIALIEKKNKGIINDSISYRLEKIITKEIYDSNSLLPKLNPIIIKDDYTETQLEYEIIKICMTSNSTDIKIKSLPIPSRIDRILEARGKRFGLITFCSGFTRTKSNYKNEYLAGVLKNVIETVALSSTGNGLFVSINGNLSSSLSLNIMIVDAEKNNITFFNEALFKTLNVLDEKLIKKEIAKLVSKFFKKEK
jgi:hypothetical protein